MTEASDRVHPATTSGPVPEPFRAAPRPPRRPLVPLWVYGAIAAAVAVVVIGLSSALALNRSVTRPVPDVTGLDAGVARTRLRQSGFEYELGDRRFSVKPADSVLEQDPPAGHQARRGSVVTVVVSAGTEEFRLPDVVGDGITLARGTLLDRGLEVKVNAEASDQPKDTVLSTNPSAGSIVHTGDVVLVSVAATSTVEGAIVPYRLPGALFVLDPSRLSESATDDVPLDIARRLRSLLEASGASVLVTRSLADRDVSIKARADRAADASATAVLGLDIRAEGVGGIVVAVPSGLAAFRQLGTETFARSMLEALAVRGRIPAEAILPPDPLLTSTSAPLVRVSLGSLADRVDAASFRDPAWADALARAIYGAIGETYGSR